MNKNDNLQSSASQNARILAYMQEGNRITSLEALMKFGCFRLASRIHDLKERGHIIYSERIQTANGKYVKEYYMNT